MMADSARLGNLLWIGLLSASAVVWLGLVRRRLSGQTWLPERAVPRTEWDPAGVLLLFAGAFLLPVLLLQGIDPEQTFDTPVLRQMCLAGAVQTALVFLGRRVLQMRSAGAESSGAGNPSDGGGLREVGVDVSLAVGGCLASLLPVWLVNLGVQWLDWRAPEGVHPLFGVLHGAGDPLQLAWLLGLVLVIAPVAEEALYRVLLQGWLLDRWPRSVAVVIPAGLFAAIHAAPGRPDHLPLFPLALVLGTVYAARRCYWSIVLLHALFNLCNLVMSLLSAER